MPDGRWTNPLAELHVNSRFNLERRHPVLKVVLPHTGTDFRAAAGTALFAASSGAVTRSLFDADRAGNYVRIAVGDGTWIGYSHLSERRVASGDGVEVGAVIGLAGDTGAATGPHLHFEVSVDGVKVDPVPFLAGRTSGDAQLVSLSVDGDDEENEMRDDERNMLFHIGALLTETPMRTALQVWGQPVSRVEGQPTTILQDTVDGTTASLSTTVELAAMTAAVQALAAAQGLDVDAVTAAARAGARSALRRAPQVDIDEEALALALAHHLPGLTQEMSDEQVDQLAAALGGERTRRGRA